MTAATLLGVDLTGEGAHPAAWRAARHEPSVLHTPARIAGRLGAVERAGFSFATLPDGPGDPSPGVRARLDSVELAAYASAVTTRLGLVPVAGAIHAEPYHLANQLSSLDWGSKGRAGWIVRVSDDAGIAGGYGREQASSPAALAKEARDVVRAVRLLWDTWEDDALIADEASHRFIDLDRWHHADFVGETFSIKGPGLLPRSPQGQLVVWGDPSGPGGEELAPLLDVALVDGGDLAAVAAAAAAARDAGIPRVVASAEVVVSTRLRSADERLRELDAHAQWPPAHRPRIVGTPTAVAAALAALADHVDGIVVHPAVIDEDLPTLAADVRELLAESVALHRPAEGETLRDAFGLDRPVSSFAVREHITTRSDR